MKLLALISRFWVRFAGGDVLINYLRKQGMKIGANTRIFSDISTSESYLVEIGDNTTISNDVQLITHDASISKVLPDKTDLFGKIIIGKNCFVGARSIIMYGVTLPDNTIVAAGSVVTNGVSEPGKILGGNPARVIGDVEEFAKKNQRYAVNIRGLSAEEKRLLLQNEESMVCR